MRATGPCPKHDRPRLDSRRTLQVAWSRPKTARVLAVSALGVRQGAQVETSPRNIPSLMRYKAGEFADKRSARAMVQVRNPASLGRWLGRDAMPADQDRGGGAEGGVFAALNLPVQKRGAGVLPGTVRVGQPQPARILVQGGEEVEGRRGEPPDASKPPDHPRGEGRIQLPDADADFERAGSGAPPNAVYEPGTSAESSILIPTRPHSEESQFRMLTPTAALVCNLDTLRHVKKLR